MTLFTRLSVLQKTEVRWIIACLDVCTLGVNFISETWEILWSHRPKIPGWEVISLLPHAHDSLTHWVNCKRNVIGSKEDGACWEDDMWFVACVDMIDEVCGSGGEWAIVGGGSEMAVDCWVLSREILMADQVDETVESSLETYRGGCLDRSCCCVMSADALGFLISAILTLKLLLQNGP